MGVKFGQLRGVQGLSYLGQPEQAVKKQGRRGKEDGYEGGGSSKWSAINWTYSGIAMNVLAGLAFGTLHATGLGIAATMLASMCLVMATVAHSKS